MVMTGNQEGIGGLDPELHSLCLFNHISMSPKGIVALNRVESLDATNKN